MRRILGSALAIAAFATSLFGSARAQLTPAPGAVNDCTLLTNPTELQECLQARAGLDQRFVPKRHESQDRAGPILKDEGVLREKAIPPP